MYQSLRNFFGCFTGGYPADVDFFAGYLVVEWQACQTSRDYILRSDAGVNVSKETRLQCLIGYHQGKQTEIDVGQIELPPDAVNDSLFMHNPAEDDIPVCLTLEKAVQQITDIINDHPLCFLGDSERIHIPAPVTIQKYRRRKPFFQFAADGGFS